LGVVVQVMVPIFERYTTDPSKWVRQAAFQHLGPFIATLSSAQVTPGLLKHYIDMAAAQDADDKSDAFDPDMPAYCAFSFPAVAVTIGKDRWAEISGLFHTLARDQQRKVRKPMAHSLHEVPAYRVYQPLCSMRACLLILWVVVGLPAQIAKLLGEHTAETELLSTFHLYLKDVDEVKVGVIKNLAGFLGALSADYRCVYCTALLSLLLSILLL
jgi:serine/threonine-protein phosphatase 4 regulatory subunit 1